MPEYAKAIVGAIIAVCAILTVMRLDEIVRLLRSRP